MSSQLPQEEFARALARLEERLSLPYPERAELLDELAADLEGTYLAQRARGLDEKEALVCAMQGLPSDPTVLESLDEVHRPVVGRALRRFPRSVRAWVEPVLAFFALAAAMGVLGLSVNLRQLLKEGGPSNILVCTSAVLALLIQLQRAAQWFVVRNHSRESLAQQNAVPVYLAGAIALLGMMGTGVNLHVVLSRYSEGIIPREVLPLGVMESLSTLILGAAGSAIVLFVQAATVAGLRAMRVPEPHGK